MSDKISTERLEAIRNEIVMAEALTKNTLEPKMNEAVSRYLGDFSPSIGENWDIVLNEIYPIVQNYLPSIFFRNPRAFLKPRQKTYIVRKRDPVSGKMVDVQLDSTKSARTQEAILNYSLSQIKFKQEVRKVLLDALIFPYGILWHGYKGNFGMTEEKSIFIKKDNVFVKRISPNKFLFDPTVTLSDLDDARWVARVIDIRMEDLVEDKSLDVEKDLIKGFKGFGNKIKSSNSMNQEGKDKITFTSILEASSDQFKKSQAANFVRLYEVFLRPSKKEELEGKSGYILLLTNEQKKPLRVNEWVIKAEGFPALPLYFNDVPDQTYPMPDVDTYKAIADNKNLMSNLIIRNATESGKVWVALSKNGANEEDIEKVSIGENTIIMYDDTDVRNRMSVMSPGGQSSSELYLSTQRLQRELEDKSGVSDLRKGFLQSGEESAASVKIRSAGGSARSVYRQDLMADFLKASLLYLNQLNKQFKNFEDAVRIIGSLDVEWVDNISEEDLQADVDVEIDAYSMLPENPEKELRELNTVLLLLIDGFRDPAIRQKLQQEGKTVNFAPLIEQILLRMKINNPDVFRNIRPEESEGYVSVSEVRAAKANVEAALSRNPNIPSPPQQGQDHRARMEVYSSIMQVIQGMGKTITSQILSALMQAHQQLLAEIDAKEAKGDRVLPPEMLKKPTVRTI